MNDKRTKNPIRSRRVGQRWRWRRDVDSAAPHRQRDVLMPPQHIFPNSNALVDILQASIETVTIHRPGRSIE